MSIKSTARWILQPFLILAICGNAAAQISFEREPINYSSRPAQDPIARLQQQIDRDEVKLEFDREHGYLQSVLQTLGIPRSSQMLVFSKTSFQQRLISPRSPRALYFNDSVYVGWVHHGDVLEISSVDPEQGAIFYTLDQQSSARPRFIRDQGNCLTCHASSRTHGVPGHLVRSVYPSASGLPHFGAGTFRTDHASPLSERWGGWFVSGTHGDQRHMGNVTSLDREHPERLDREAGANVTDLSNLTATENYLTPHSDIVALMVLEHQADMHNLITLASYEARMAAHYDAIMNEALERPDDHVSDSAKRRLDRAAEKLVHYMLFADETALTAPIAGTSEFTKEFGSLGPHDRKGRSLRQFDLQRRIFKYPCSYLIYSDAFRALPAAVKERVYAQLWEALGPTVPGSEQAATDPSAQDQDTFGHLSASDRSAIREILIDTLDELPAYWRQKG